MESAALRQIEQQLALLSKEDQLALAAKLQELIAAARHPESLPEKVVDWEQYRGILNHGPDPLEYQRQCRAEWDRP